MRAARMRALAAADAQPAASSCRRRRPPPAPGTTPSPVGSDRQGRARGRPCDQATGPPFRELRGGPPWPRELRPLHVACSMRRMGDGHARLRDFDHGTGPSKRADRFLPSHDRLVRQSSEHQNLAAIELVGHRNESRRPHAVSARSVHLGERFDECAPLRVQVRDVREDRVVQVLLSAPHREISGALEIEPSARVVGAIDSAATLGCTRFERAYEGHRPGWRALRPVIDLERLVNATKALENDTEREQHASMIRRAANRRRATEARQRASPSTGGAAASPVSAWASTTGSSTRRGLVDGPPHAGRERWRRHRVRRRPAQGAPRDRSGDRFIGRLRDAVRLVGRGTYVDADQGPCAVSLLSRGARVSEGQTVNHGVRNGGWLPDSTQRRIGPRASPVNRKRP